MMNQKLGYVVFALAAAGCAINGKQVFGLGSLAGAGGGGGGGGASGGGGSGGGGPAHPAPASYAWCRDLQEDSGANRVEDALDPESPVRAVAAVAQALCFPDDQGRRARDTLEGARQRWMQRLLLEERDWATDVVAWANLRYADRVAVLRATIYPVEGAPWTGMPPLEQWALLRTHVGPSDAFALRPGAFYYLADALPPTAAGRLGLLERCLDGDGSPSPAAWAICQPDVDALDPAKLAAEIRAAAARPLADRMAIRFAADQLLRRLPAHAARVQQLIAKDPAYARLFEIARAARAEWDARAGARADLLAAVLAMDDARATGSRKAMAGCAERAWPLFSAAVAALPPSRFEGLRPEPGTSFLANAVGAVLQRPEAYLAANALVACEGASDALLAALGAGLTRWPGFRGPRTAAITAIRLANLVPDRRGETIEVPAVALPLAIGAAREAPRVDGTGAGVIASVAPQGDSVRVAFRTTSEVQDHCVSRRTTGRISRIDDNGEVRYETVCAQWRAARVDTTPRPVEVARRYAGGLAAGRYTSILGGVPEAVWTKPSAPTPLAAFGVPLR